MKKIERRNKVFLGDRVLTKSEAREVLSNLRKTESSCKAKINKVNDRISLIQKFIDQTSGEKITISEWMADQNLDFKDYFTSIGYFTPTMDAVSNDPENNFMSYHKTMIFNPKVGFCTPNPEIVKENEHNEVTSSMLGFTYNPKLAQYFPTTVYDTEAYRESEKNGDNAPHIMGGYLVSDMANFSAMDGESKELLEDVIDLYEDELDGVVEEYETVNKIADTIYNNDQYYGADGRPLANSTCRTTCGVKHPFNKSKREDCQDECDEKYPPTEKQEERRDNREERKEIRQEKRSEIKDCRELFRTGKINRKEFRKCKREARQEKRQKLISETGGSGFQKFLRFTNKVDLINVGARGAFLTLLKGNLFGMSTRLAPAVLPLNEAKKHFKPSSIPKAKKAWAQAKEMWWQVGGEENKLKDAIEKGWRKSPKGKDGKTSSFDGEDSELYSYSGGGWIGLVTAAIGLISSFVGALTSSKADKNPYKSGQTPPNYEQGLRSGVVDENVPVGENTPRFDPIKNKWVDPVTGRPIDPQTGKFADTILGLNKWVFLGLTAVVATSAVLLFVKTKK